MFLDGSPSDLKRQRQQAGPSVDEDSPMTGISGGGVGLLPSKEAVASKGLEAKVDMATYGQSSWALTSLGAWRNNSLKTENSAQFVKNRQRQARRELLRPANASAGGGGGGGGGTGPAVTTATPAIAPGQGCCREMAVEKS